MQVRTRAPLTYADFVRFPDDGRRHELIGGVHYVTPSPATRHQRLVVRLIGAFYDYFAHHPVGEVFTAPFDTVLSEHDVVEPDLLIILRRSGRYLDAKRMCAARRPSSSRFSRPRRDDATKV